MKDKRKSLETAMEYQILRDRALNKYIQIREAHPEYDVTQLGKEIWRLQVLFEFWASVSGILTLKGDNK